MTRRIRLGIIGCSSIARKSTIPAINQVSNARLQCVGSRSPIKAKKFAKQFSCPDYGDYDYIFENKDIDAVYISLPPALNEKFAIKAAKHGKHVLCEKSATVSYKSAKKLIYECKKNKVRIMENFAFRFHPQHKKVQEIVSKNKLGKIHFFDGKFGFVMPYSKQNFRFQKKIGGGVLNDVGCYLICASRLIFKSKPSRIFCNLEIDKQTGVDIKGSIILVYSKNQIATCTFGYKNFFQSTYELWGDKGILKLQRAFNIKNKMHANIEFQTANKTNKIKIKPHNQFKSMISIFCKELLNPHSSNFNFENELLEQALVMDAARKSYSANQVINI